MTPAQELRSLRAKLKRRDKKIAELAELANFWAARAGHMKNLWERERNENRALYRDLAEEYLCVAGLQGEIAMIHTHYAMRGALHKLQAGKGKP